MKKYALRARCGNTIKNESNFPPLIIHHLLLTCHSVGRFTQSNIFVMAAIKSSIKMRNSENKSCKSKSRNIVYSYS